MAGYVAGLAAGWWTTAASALVAAVATAAATMAATQLPLDLAAIRVVVALRPGLRYLPSMRRRSDILKDALQLSDEERGALAVELLDSISATDERDSARWIAEIERRAKRALEPEALNDPTVEDAVARIERDLDL